MNQYTALPLRLESEQIEFLSNVNKEVKKIIKYIKKNDKSNYIIEYYDVNDYSELQLREKCDILFDQKQVNVTVHVVHASHIQVGFIIYKNKTKRKQESNVCIILPEHYDIFMSQEANVNVQASIIARAYAHIIYCIKNDIKDYILSREDINMYFNYQ